MAHLVDIAAARARLAESAARLRAVRRELVDHLRAARALAVPDVSAERLTELRQARVQQVTQHYAPQVAAIKTAIERDAGMLRNQLGELLPKMPGDTASIMRAQVRWDAVRLKIESGTPLRQILKTADLDTTLAVAEWGPSWLAVAAAPNSNLGAALTGEAQEQFDPAAIEGQIHARLAELVGGDLAATLAAAREAEGVQAETAPAIEHAERVLTGDPAVPVTDLGTAVQAALAGQAARTSQPDAEPVPA